MSAEECASAEPLCSTPGGVRQGRRCGVGRRARARRGAMTGRQRHSIKASCASEAVQIELLHPHTGEPLLVRALEGEGRVARCKHGSAGVVALGHVGRRDASFRLSSMLNVREISAAAVSGEHAGEVGFRRIFMKVRMCDKTYAHATASPSSTARRAFVSAATSCLCCATSSFPVSYTHLTLPTIYSV